MKRIVLFAMTTLTILVLLFGYHTSTSSRLAASDSSVVAPVVSGGAVSGGAVSGGSVSGGSATGGSAGTPATSTPSTAAAITSPTTTASGTTASGTTAPRTTGAGSSTGTTFLGESADTQWGPVQVQITVQNGKITAVSVPVYPDNNGRDQEINATALPTLVQETLSAQSAKIDMVSGATVTSGGYLTSLQSALDKAGL